MEGLMDVAVEEQNQQEETLEVLLPQQANDFERELYSSGQNSYGELGHNDTAERHIPELIAFCKQHSIMQAAAGNEHTSVLCSDGSVYCCGYNDSGQCGQGHTGRVPTLRRIDAFDGKQVVMIQSANGCEHLAAVTEDGELYTCGYNSRGQLGHGTNITIPSPRLVESLLGHRVTKVACSYYHSMVATDTGSLYAFGRNDFGQLGVGDTLDKFSPTLIEGLSGRFASSLACGQYHSSVALVGGGIYTFGKNDYGQLGIDSPDPRPRPGLVAAPLTDANVVQVSCGYYHTIVLGARGDVWTFGRNDYGQLGIGSRDNSWRPQQVKDLTGRKIVQIATGCYHSVTLSSEGKVYPFGRNNHGQLATGNTRDSPRPTLVAGLQDKFICQIAAGFYHTLFLAGPRTRVQQTYVLKTLSSDLRQLLNNPQRNDVRFIVEDRVIHAHRCILLARCEPLAKMLDGSMRESQEGEIPMPGVQYNVFLAFLEFLYTDEVSGFDAQSVPMDFALDLLSLADQYLVEALKRKCEMAIQKSITVENVSFMLATSDARRALELRRRCFEFILVRFGEVIGTKSFSELPTNLLQEVLAEASRRGVQVGLQSSSPRT